MVAIASNAALLVVDMQKGFDDPSWGRRCNPLMELRIMELLRAFRETKRPIIHCQHMSTRAGSPLRPGQPGNELKAEAAPLRGEPVIAKQVNSCFIGTTLEEDLHRWGYGSLVIVGLTTNHCVSTTARMAGNLGFGAFVISDATAAFDRRGPDGREHPAELIHSIALSDLHQEFATVVDTPAVLEALRRPS